MGALPALVKLIPIGRFMDHGETVEIARPMVALVGDRRTILKPGDKIPLKGIDIQVVMSGGQAITKPLSGAAESRVRRLPAAPARQVCSKSSGSPYSRSY